MIALIVRHESEYPGHTARDRLKQVDQTPLRYRRLSTSSHERAIRESAIPEKDVEAAITFFVEHPDVGAAKARATLIAQEKAWISTANLNRVKQELTALTAQQYKERREAEKLLEAQLREDLAARKKSDYKHMKATRPHQIWAIDFVNITFLGMFFVLCVVYDEYSQEYPGILVGMGGDQHLAAATFEKALAQTPTRPVYIRRDNGKPFSTELFQKQLDGVVMDYPVPPHSPWYNGSLESCNGSLKKGIKTAGMQGMVINPTRFREARQDTNRALETLQDIVSGVRTTLNQEIARLRHGMTPAQVISGKEEARAKQNAFLDRKRQERIERMAEIRANPKRKPTTLIDKTRTIVKRVIGKLETNAIYVLDEVLHHRFRAFET